MTNFLKSLGQGFEDHSPARCSQEATVLLVHGVGGNCDRFTKDGHNIVHPLCCAGYRVITLDLRGHGLSSRTPNHLPLPEEFSLPNLANDVIMLLNTLEVVRTDIVAFSFGCRISMALGLGA